MLNIRSMGHVSIVVDNVSSAEKYYSELFNTQTIASLMHFKNEGMAKNMGIEGVELSEKVIKFSHCNLVLLLVEFHTPKGNAEVDQKALNDLGGVRHIGLNVEDIETAFDFIKMRKDVEILNKPDFRPVSYSKILPEQFEITSRASSELTPEKERLAELLSEKKTFFFRDRYGVIWEIEQRFFKS